MSSGTSGPSDFILSYRISHAVSISSCPNRKSTSIQHKSTTLFEWQLMSEDYIPSKIIMFRLPSLNMYMPIICFTLKVLCHNSVLVRSCIHNYTFMLFVHSTVIMIDCFVCACARVEWTHTSEVEQHTNSRLVCILNRQ